VRIPTIALVKLPNNPTINIAIVSRNFWDTNNTAIKTIELPMVEAKTTPGDSNKVLKNGGKSQLLKVQKLLLN
jgi:hypothetical protein